MNASDSAAQFPAQIGLGTWELGTSSAQRGHDTEAVAHALQVGYRLIDTAEMYGNGGAECIVGAAIQSFGVARRPKLFIVSKVLPGNASRRGCARSCEASIKRLGCDYLDMYLLHWPGSHPITETLRGFDDLMKRGLIRNFGVSNLDLAALSRWHAAQVQLDIQSSLTCNQIYYCLQQRGAEFDLLPWQRQHAIRTMAYSPLGRGSLVRHPLVVQLARARGASAAQIALAWCTREPDVIAIPKSADPQRIEQNWQSTQLRLSAAELAQIDRALPPPTSPQPLATA